jgi:TolA-binding protein
VAQRQGDLEEQLARLQAEHEKLNRDFDQLSFENRGRKLAWKIHRVDELLAAKKTYARDRKRGSGKVSEERIPAAAHGILGVEAVLWHPGWLGQGF